jgi:hypothetical protein
MTPRQKTRELAERAKELAQALERLAVDLTELEAVGLSPAATVLPFPSGSNGTKKQGSALYLDGRPAGAIRVPGSAAGYWFAPPATLCRRLGCGRYRKLRLRGRGRKAGWVVTRPRGGTKIVRLDELVADAKVSRR